MKVKKLILAVMLSVLLLGFGTSYAATSAIDNVPGGAGYVYWQADGAWSTLVNIQSIVNVLSMTVHVAIYDHNSVERADYQFPMTPLDGVGFVLVGNPAANTVTIIPYSDNAWGGSGIPPAGNVFFCPANGGLQYGYISVVIDKIAAPPIDPTLLPSFTQTEFINPDWIYMRNALIRGTDAAFGINSIMFQGFGNAWAFDLGVGAGVAAGLTEVPVVGVESQFANTFGADALCVALPTNWDGTAAITFASIDDVQGPNIDSWELYGTWHDFGAVFVNLPPHIIVDGAAAGPANCNPAGRVNVLGSANGRYYGRYNQTPGLTDSTLIMVFPASSQPGTADPRVVMTVVSYDDDENGISTSFVPPEVALCPYGAASIPLPGNTPISILGPAGETFITTATPMFGWTYTETAGFADVYPLYRDFLNIVRTNLFDAAGNLIVDPAAPEVDTIVVP